MGCSTEYWSRSLELRVDRRRARKRRHLRVRKKISGTPERPRLCVFRSSKHTYAQLVDDVSGRVLTAASTLEKPIREMELPPDTPHPKVAIAKEVGKRIAEKALQLGIKQVVFDRGGYKYHGRVAAVAEGAREGGLEL